MIRLVATDLDGTLIRSDGTVSTRTIRALQAVEAAGIVVVLITGRPPRWMGPVTDAIGHTGVAICANGALIYDLHSETLLSRRMLEPARALAVAGRLRREIPDLMFAAEYGFGFGQEPGYKHNWEIGGCDVRTGPVSALLDQPVAKLLARHLEYDCDTLVARALPIVGTDATVTSSSWEAMLEISAFGVTKATTLAQFARSLGVSPGQVIAFGDMPNDVEMLAWSGRAIAVANAHQEVLAVADEVTASNDDDGVALVLERLAADHAGAA